MRYVNGATIPELASPVTQTRDAVAQLIAYLSNGKMPEEMPAFYRLTGDIVLVQNAKKDAYYITTTKACSCPSAAYLPNQPCKHQRLYFPLLKKPDESAVNEPQIERGGFRPFLED